MGCRTLVRPGVRLWRVVTMCVSIVLANDADIEEKSDHVSGGALQRGCMWYFSEHDPGPMLWELRPPGVCGAGNCTSI